MSRKPIGIFDASVPITCKSSGCAHEFFVTPTKLQKKQPIICPKCRHPNEFTGSEVLERRSRNVAHLKAAHRRITDKGDD